MIFGNILYRTKQFWQAYKSSPLPEDLEMAQAALTPVQMELFRTMQPSEQAHSLRVYIDLLSVTDKDHLPQQGDLLAAALLHEVGKSQRPLRIHERVIIVLGRAIFPNAVKHWGQEETNIDGDNSDGLGITWYKVPFVVAELHPRWGASLAGEAGVSPLTASLIRNHQNFSVQNPVTLEEQLLIRLQTADGAH